MSQMQTNENERGEAKTDRDKENADFLLSEADMVTGIGAVDQAMTLLRAVTPESFLQRAGTAAAARLKAAQQAVQKASVYGDAKLRRRAQAWLSGTKRDGEIVGVLATLNDTMTANLENCRLAEDKAAEDYNKTATVSLAEWQAMSDTSDGKKTDL